MFFYTGAHETKLFSVAGHCFPALWERRGRTFYSEAERLDAKSCGGAGAANE